MEFRFKAEEFGNLPHQERVRRCHLLAEESRQLASSADSDRLKEAYLHLAMEWLQLADSFERDAGTFTKQRGDGG